MTSSRVIVFAIRGRLNEYEFSASLIFTPDRRWTSPDAALAVSMPAVSAVTAAMPIDRVRNSLRNVGVLICGLVYPNETPASAALPAPACRGADHGHPGRHHPRDQRLRPGQRARQLDRRALEDRHR